MRSSLNYLVYLKVRASLLVGINVNLIEVRIRDENRIPRFFWRGMTNLLQFLLWFNLSSDRYLLNK